MRAGKTYEVVRSLILDDTDWFSRELKGITNAAIGSKKQTFGDSASGEVSQQFLAATGG